jgi:hypothetical protein
METTTNKSRKTLLVKLRFGSETLKIHNCRAILDNRKTLLVKLKFNSKTLRIHNGRATLHNAKNKSRESLPMKSEPGHQPPRIDSNKLKSEGVATDLKSYPMSGLPHYSALLLLLFPFSLDLSCVCLLLDGTRYLRRRPGHPDCSTNVQCHSVRLRCSFIR